MYTNSNRPCGFLEPDSEDGYLELLGALRNAPCR